MEKKTGFSRIAAASATALALIMGNGAAHKAQAADAPSAPSAATTFSDPGLYGTYCRAKNGLQFYANKQATKIGHLLDKHSDSITCVDVRVELLKRGIRKPEGVMPRGNILKEIAELRREIKQENAALRAHKPAP